MGIRTPFLFCFAAAFVSAAEIPQGTHLLLRMENSLSTRTAKEGDYVYLRSASPIAVNGQIIVPVGSYVQGVVAETKRSGRVSGRAELAIRLETLTLAQGTVVKFAPHLNSVDSGDSGQKVAGAENKVEQAPTKGKDAARIAILAGTGASIGGIADRSWTGAGIGAAAGSAVGLATVLLARGKEVELRQGSTLDVVFDRPIAIE
jgi:type IV secretion system protein VirB10